MIMGALSSSVVESRQCCQASTVLHFVAFASCAHLAFDFRFICCFFLFLFAFVSRLCSLCTLLLSLLFSVLFSLFVQVLLIAI